MSTDALFDTVYGKRLGLFVMGSSQVVADIQAETDEAWIVVNPMVLQSLPAPDGKLLDIRLSKLSPYFWKGKKVMLRKQYVVAVAGMTDKDVVNAYLSATGGKAEPDEKIAPGS